MPPTAYLTKVEVEDQIREVAARPGIGGYRTIASTLLAEFSVAVSHMPAQRMHKNGEGRSGS